MALPALCGVFGIWLMGVCVCVCASVCAVLSLIFGHCFDYDYDAYSCVLLTKLSELHTAKLTAKQFSSILNSVSIIINCHYFSVFCFKLLAICFWF